MMSSSAALERWTHTLVMNGIEVQRVDSSTCRHEPANVRCRRAACLSANNFSQHHRILGLYLSAQARRTYRSCNTGIELLNCGLNPAEEPIP